MQPAEGKLYLFVAIDRTGKLAFVHRVDSATRVTGSTFLASLIAVIPCSIHTTLTGDGIQLRYVPHHANGPTARYMTRMFTMRCRENGIERRLSKINHLRTDGQVEQIGLSIKDATVQL